MKIGIIIVNFNSSDHTIACLNSLEKISKNNMNVKVYVVDNNSEKPINIDDKRLELNTETIYSKLNLGFSGGMNLGIKKALDDSCDYFLILNNDTLHEKEFLKLLLEGVSKNNADIVSPKIYYQKGREYHSDRYEKADLGKVLWYAGGKIDWKNILVKHRGVDEVDYGQFDDQIDTDFATGCAMLISKKVVENIGLFDENYFLYLEDIDFSIRAKKKGFRIAFIPQSVIYHYNAGSTEGSGSRLHDYFITRNRLLFGMRYASIRTKIALTRESVGLLFFGRTWQKIGVRDFYLRRLGKGSI